MNSCVRSPRDTDQPTGREEEEDTTQRVVAAPRTAVAPTTAVGVDVEDTTTTLDMVHSLSIHPTLDSLKLLQIL